MLTVSYNVDLIDEDRILQGSFTIHHIATVDHIYDAIAEFAYSESSDEDPYYAVGKIFVYSNGTRVACVENEDVIFTAS